MATDKLDAEMQWAERVARLERELAEARDQQAATSEILRAITGSPFDLQPILDAVAEQAARVCGAVDAQLWRVEGDRRRLVAHYGPQWAPTVPSYPVTRGTPHGRAILDRRTVHVRDVAAEAPTDFRDLESIARQEPGLDLPHLTWLATPLLREGAAIGAILVRRAEVNPFTDRQIGVLETFADEAAIAIQNMQLFQALQARNRDLTEALEQQTATAEILRVISSSPTDLQPVLDTVAENAARICGADDAIILRIEGDQFRRVATHGPIPKDQGEIPPASPCDRATVAGRAVVERRTIHVPDVAAVETEYPGTSARARRLGFQTILATPLLREGTPIGVITIRRAEVRPFAERQITLLETFADQAVIAIENTRLFSDLREALDRQTATAEVLRVIASSPTDLQRVLDTIAESAARVCGAADATVHRIDGDVLPVAAVHGPLLDGRPGPGPRLDPGSVAGRAVLDRRSIHIADFQSEEGEAFPLAQPRFAELGVRTVLATPLLRKGVSIGAILIRRIELCPFTDKQIELLETFADQAVIAIENARLFNELQDRVDELRALGEVGQAVSSTLDLGRVLDTVVAHADELSGTDGGALYEYDEAAEEFRLRTTRQFDADLIRALRSAPVRLGEGAIGRAARAREPIQIPDVTVEDAYHGRLLEALVAAGHRAVLAVPLLREERILGGLVVVRKSPGAFPPNVVELVKTFASQSALAIQNARLYREVEEKSLQLEVASKHKSDFLANMSHELRTPLNAIIGFSEVLLERMFGELNDKQDEYLRDILSSGQHLLSLINDILDLSKVEAGRMDLEVSTFSLHEALENGLTMLKERAGRHGITLGLEIEPGLDQIEADERKVKQVVFNLLSNAVKFTPGGGRVEVIARRSGGAVQVSVRDTGIGIALEDLPNVFEEFRQVGQGEAKAEGTGLGLALTKRLVELHGGCIWAESEIGVGSSFVFTLPQPALPHRLEARR